MEELESVESEPKLELEPDKCQYVFKKGKNAGKQCEIRKTPYCHRHKQNSSNTLEVIDLPKCDKEEEEEPIAMAPLPKSEDYDEIDAEEYREEKTQNSQKEQQIKTYYTEFTWLNEELPLDSRDQETADEWLSLIYRKINTHGVDTIIKHGYATACYTVEKIGIANGYHFQGATDSLLSNERVLELLKIIRMQNDDLFAEVSPSGQLLMLTCGTFLTMSFVSRSQPQNDPHRISTDPNLKSTWI
jgi:hypothetical protein